MRRLFLILGLLGVVGCASLPREHRLDPAYPPALKEVHFESHGDRLNGIVYVANGPGPHPTVILLHGFPGNEKNLMPACCVRTRITSFSWDIPWVVLQP